MRLSLLRASVLAVGLVAAAPAQDSKPGVETPAADIPMTTTASGLKYQVLKAGPPGKTPKRGDFVKVHYEGRLTDGKVFDSSYQRGEPAKFRLGRVIEGWNEGLGLMTVGAKWRLTIPSELGYGKQGTPDGSIPPDATLVFDVELIATKAGDPLPQPPAFVAVDEAKATTTASKIKCETVCQGEGEAAVGDDVLVVNFNVWGPDNKLLQSSAATGEPIRIPVKQLSGQTGLPFMRELLPKMKAGEKCRVAVPAEQAYGTQGAGGIPPGATTTWELEVVKILKASKPPEFVKPADMKLEKTPSGLEYEFLRTGDGASPTLDDTVVINYTGWFLDGKVFDSSAGRGEPASFPLKRLIAGWQEGLQMMKEGSAARFVIPAALAYGARGRPPQIPADATLVFVVELVRVDW